MTCRDRRLAALCAAAALGAGAALLFVGLPLLARWLDALLTRSFSFDRRAVDSTAAMRERLAQAALETLGAIVPFGAVIAAVAVAAAVLAGGWNFTFAPLAPKLSKLDPVAGLGRLLSPRSLVGTVKGALLALVLGAIGAFYLKMQWPRFALLLAAPLPDALVATALLLRDGLALLLLALVGFALLDVPLQRHLLLRRLRMSVEEARQEHKELEGNTEVKGKIKARMRELARRRMLAAVPLADLVVTNPTHYAVALRYDDRTMAAPRVVAKGADLLALKIRELARSAQVPVLEAPPLARALHAHAEVDEEIPAALFGAVAQVLAWVYQLRAALAAGRAANMPPPAVEVPAGMDPAAAAGAGR
jgi:flagellar biosynthetic protein FlhB